MGTVFDIKKFALHDGDGIRTTVFFKGCPLDCWWCHNPESRSPLPQRVFRNVRCIRCTMCLDVCENEAIDVENTIPVFDEDRCDHLGRCAEACPSEAVEMVGNEMSVAEVMAAIERDFVFYDESGGGVTFSGGEPAMQADFLCELLAACRERAIHTAVDTSGYAPAEQMRRIAALTDLLLYDVKIMDDARHKQYTGVSNELILENLREAATISAQGSRPAVTIRVPVIPGVNDDAANFEQLSAYVSTLPKGADVMVELLPYQPFGESKYELLDLPQRIERRELPEEHVQALAGVLQEAGITTKLRGMSS